MTMTRDNDRAALQRTVLDVLSDLRLVPKARACREQIFVIATTMACDHRRHYLGVKG